MSTLLDVQNHSNSVLFNHGDGDEQDSESEVPDVFSLVAQESLLDAFQPAFKHLIKVVASKFPESCSWMYRFYDELYLMTDAALQFYSFSHHRGSFSEHFYGMKRKPVNGNTWSKKLKVFNLIQIVFYPYIKRKLESYFEHLAIEKANSKLNGQDYMSKLKRAFVSIYPYLHFTWSVLMLLYFLRFLFKFSDIHSPLLSLCRSKLVACDSDSSVEGLDLLALLKDIRSLTTLRQATIKLFKALPLLLYQTFSASVFFLQFLQWYSSFEQARSEENILSPAAVIPPPKRLESSVDGLLCPICMQTRTNQTVLSVSGFVFCYPCIYTYVKNNSKCPITGLPASLTHLTKIYLTEP